MHWRFLSNISLKSLPDPVFRNKAASSEIVCMAKINRINTNEDKMILRIDGKENLFWTTHSSPCLVRNKKEIHRKNF